MEQQLAPAELLRFLQAEAATLQQMQVKISNELHHLQVEEEVFVHTIDRLNQKLGMGQSISSTTKARAEEETRGCHPGMELLEALHQELALGICPEFILQPDSAPPTTSSLHPASTLPPDAALPTILHAMTATETGSPKDVKVESQSAAPFGMSFGDDDEYEEYELLDRLNSEDE